MYDGAVMITASHLPCHRNGFKFFSKAGGLNKQNIAEVRGNGGVKCSSCIVVGDPRMPTRLGRSTSTIRRPGDTAEGGGSSHSLLALAFMAIDLASL